MEGGFVTPGPGTEADVLDLGVAFGPTHLDSASAIGENGLGEDMLEAVEAWVDGNGLGGVNAVCSGHPGGEAGFENILGHFGDL